MAEPSSVFVYGPIGFVAASCVASLLLTPSTTRWLRRRKARRSMLRSREQAELAEMFGSAPKRELDRVLGLLWSIVGLWSLSSLIGGLLLLLPASERPDQPPGTYVDAMVVAHAVPPISGWASDRLVARLAGHPEVSRWSPEGALEERLVLAARLDRSPERGALRLVERGFRTRGARFALANPSDRACEVAMPAAAEALRGGLLSELMVACRNAKGDSAAHAAFKMGDFLRAAGPEAESIVSRVTRAPQDEPECAAGGYDTPPAEQPLCRLIHAEVKPNERASILPDLRVAPPFAQAWLRAMHVERGAPMRDEDCFTVDADQLVLRPFDALADLPLALLQDLRSSTRANLTPGQAAWVRLALAGGRSMMGKHQDAALLSEEGLALLDLGQGATPAERSQAQRLAAAIAIRSGDEWRRDQALAELLPTDTLHALAAALDREDPALDVALLEHDATPYLRAPLTLSSASAPARPLLRQWLRERFPSCVRCGFFRELRRLVSLNDAAYALGDAELSEELSPVLARFEAVLLNRSLSLSLRAADPGATSE